MGYTRRHGTSIQDFEPDNDARTFYVRSDIQNTMQDLLDQAEAHWPGILMSEITIESQKIHTRCLTYDQYDPSDYDDFLVMTASNDYFERIKGN